MKSPKYGSMDVLRTQPLKPILHRGYEFISGLDVNERLQLLPKFRVRHEDRPVRCVRQSSDSVFCPLVENCDFTFSSCSLNLSPRFRRLLPKLILPYSTQFLFHETRQETVCESKRTKA